MTISVFRQMNRFARSAVGCVALASLAAGVAGCNSSSESVSSATTPQKPLHLVKESEFLLHDPETPVQYLHELTPLPDGGFAAVDFVAAKVRRFDAQGELVGYIEPPELDQFDEWGPMASGLSSDASSLWINDRQGRLWLFNLESGSARLTSSNRRLHGFAVSPLDVFVALHPMESGELHLYEDGAFVKHFLPSDENNLSIGAKAAPRVTFDDEGNIYAIRNLEGTVFAYSPEGDEIRRWPVLRDRNFREFPRGVNPMNVTRDRNVLLAWRRTFTSFTRIEYVQDGRLAILMANDPPERPNTLALYSTQGDYLGSTETDQYLVAASAEKLFFSDGYLFFDGVCRISRYALAE